MSQSSSGSGSRRVRARFIRAWDRGDETSVLGRDGLVRRFSGDSARLVREILALSITPRTGEELVDHLSVLAGEPVALEGSVAEALALLEAAGALEVWSAPEGRPAIRRGRLVLGVTGGIAAAYEPALVQLLLARGFEVRVATTRNALRFVSPLALEALTHHPVVTDLWPRDPSVPVPHLDLCRWADVVLVHPASATSVSRIARGDCNDVVSATAISARVPVIVVPSMNERMARAPAVARNLEQLREDGFHVVMPASGFEVADRPDARPPMYGTAPPIADVVEIVCAIAGDTSRGVPTTGAAWDEVYRSSAPERLAWYTDAADPDIAAALERVAPRPCRLLDLGTGPGTVAIEASRRGHAVVATDVSPAAIEAARRRAGSLPISWLVDDVLETRLRGTFDVVHDRGCLHVLPEHRHGAWASAVADLCAPGGALVLKVHHADEPLDLGTRKFTEARLAELLGDSFELDEVVDTTFPGPDGRAPRALLCVLRRR